MSLPKLAASFLAVGSIGGGAITLDKMHVASEDFKEYIEQQQMADDREYVRDLKKDIRDITAALTLRPDDSFLLSELADVVDELCEIRPGDRLCE